jgi:hypothetical protein
MSDSGVRSSHVAGQVQGKRAKPVVTPKPARRQPAKPVKKGKR